MARMADWSAAPTFLAALPHLAPMGFLRDLKAVVFRVGGELRVAAGLLQRDLRLLIEHVAQALVEQQREDELLVVAGINGAAQKRGCAPEVGFELLLGNAAHLINTWLNQRIEASPSIRVTSLTERLCRMPFRSSVN